VHLFCCKHSQIAASFGSVLCHNPMFRARYLLSHLHLCVIFIFFISTSTCLSVGFYGIHGIVLKCHIFKSL